MTCQGRLFLLSGEEFGRTKNGADNTYNAPIGINRLDWQRAWDNRELVEYYSGLVALRKQLPALCDKSPKAFRRVLEASVPAPRCAMVLLDNAGGRWKRPLVVYNASGHALPVPLIGEGWQLLASHQRDGRILQPEHSRRRFPQRSCSADDLHPRPKPSLERAAPAGGNARRRAGHRPFVQPAIRRRHAGGRMEASVPHGGGRSAPVGIRLERRAGGKTFGAGLAALHTEILK